MEPVLEVKNLTKNFGGLCAVSNVSMEIMPGELIGLIGPNGAGKTTLFNLLTGVYEPSEGLIEMDVDGKKRQIGGLKPYKITDYGVARTFQNIRLFKSMTVLENVQVAMQRNIRYGTMTAILRLPKFYSEERWVREKAEEYLKEVGLYGKRHELATNLPYGEQRRLEIARALAIQPKILYLDEPAAGMNPQETLELTKLGLTLILPQSWKGRYELIEWEGQYVVVCPEVREAALAQARAEWAGGEMEWPEELDRNPFSGGMLFYIFGIPEALTPEQLPDSDWGSFAEFTETRYLLATAERTYLLCHASDVQFTEETRALYERLEQSVKDIRIVVDHVL